MTDETPPALCDCGHTAADHRDGRDEWSCCSECPCLAYTRGAYTESSAL